MNTFFRIVNALLLAGILSVLILILLRIREPIAVEEPVEVEGPARRAGMTVPVQVEISR
jgi:hypothetical protein